MTYQEFLSSKIETAPQSGFEISPDEVNPALKPHQRDAVVWAVRGGRRALFEKFGLGKTAQQLEFCRIVTERVGGHALIVLPLGVKQEFIRDAVELLHMGAPVYIRNMAEAAAAPGNILLTNYERVRDGDINPAAFTAASLDEASVLRGFGSKTYQTFLDKFKGVPYKLVCTATPSPNRYKELIHYAGYLEIMDTGQALTRFFQRDSTKANNLTLYPHRERDFWLWMASWALFITKPSDLGYDDDGYDLPPLEIRAHRIADYGADAYPIDHRDGHVRLFRDAALSLQAASGEKRASMAARIAKMAEIVHSEPDEHFILWHDLEDERHAIRKALPEAVEVYGSQDLDERERRTIDFADGRIRLLATKKSISGSGCNFQRHCHRAIFVGIDYEFNDFIQAIHRIYRFQQTHPVVIDIIYTEAEEEIYKALMAKWERHDYLAETMRDIIVNYGLAAHGSTNINRKMGVERVEVKGERYTAILNDCAVETARMEENSVGLIFTSIPFGNHYEYTPNYSDFGHNPDTEAFFKQMDFLSPNLLRVLEPGRIFACHVKDRVLFGSQTGTGMPTMEPFHALCITHYMRHGFQYMGMITVLTDVVHENKQTRRLGWSQQCLDGSKMSVGCPEYILIFRKLPTDTSNAFADNRVTKSKDEYSRARWQLDAHAFYPSSGNRYLTKEEILSMPMDKLQKAYRKYSRETVYDYEEHVALAEELDRQNKLPASYAVVAPGSWSDDVWDDIVRMRTLNANQKARNVQKHVCPLQIDVTNRIINRYSNPGDVVLDPFAGLFTVPLEAVKLDRYGIGIELSEDYFRDGLGYLQAADHRIAQPTLFDFVNINEPYPVKEA